MFIPREQLSAVLGQYNPWWSSARQPKLPLWHRACFPDLARWALQPPPNKALLLAGARQIGKTTLLRQMVERLLQIGTPPSNILYATFDHPLLKTAGFDAVLEAWQDREVMEPGPKFLFLDEAQFLPDWSPWIRRQVDLHADRRIIFTGSAMPNADGDESADPWHTTRLTTLSFHEYLQLRDIDIEAIPGVTSLRNLLSWTAAQFSTASEASVMLTSHFHEYLLRGGFPQLIRVPELADAQRRLREDVLDKVLKRDMPALFGVRKVEELEQLFLYLCLHDGGLLGVADIAKDLSLPRPLVANFLQLLESAHLLFRLSAFSSSPEVARGRHKVYLSDPSTAPAMMLRSRGSLDDPGF